MSAPVDVWVCPIPSHDGVKFDGVAACCLFPGCLRRSDDPDRNSCECELYDCQGGCCGGRCSCAWMCKECGEALSESAVEKGERFCSTACADGEGVAS